MTADRRHGVLDAMNTPSVHRRGIAWFLVLTFLPTWGLWFAAYAVDHPLDDPAIQLFTGAFAPAIAALVVRMWITRQGLSGAGLRPQLRTQARWYLAALAIPPALLLIALPLGFASGVMSVPSDGVPAHLQAVAFGPLVMIVLAPIYFGEEFGWTAYLRGALAELPVLRGRPTAASAATGAIWGAWHWPLASVGYFGFQPPLHDVLLLIPLWIVMSVLLEIVWSTLWYGSGSIWPTSVAHAGFNLVFSMTMGEFLPQDAILAGFIIPSIALVPLALVAYRIDHRRRAGSPESSDSRPILDTVERTRS
ncbi:CAAX protease self-immunity [Tsukamurella pulmonis]|uniref:CAAX protease self-immunity n=2 Tax=Tsukamurella pulmonis TaxID=47312 RepID=A0A1H1F072_9ACTN|nr:CAAX protease self-immunity [Tsukamurella pulmonis]SUP20277.1 CAAX amino terminal protease self- immunity [Tsukamurella pulmonis]